MVGMAEVTVFSCFAKECTMAKTLSVAAIVLALFAFITDAPAQRGEDPLAIDVRVDPRVELMSVIFRLAGNPEYNHHASASPYADEVAEHFGEFKDHPVVLAARNLRATRGVSYDAVISMAIHIDDAVSLAERAPFDATPTSLEGRWRADEARDFLQKARQFVKDSDFAQFTADHKQLYDEAASRMNNVVADNVRLEWFEWFFGSRPGAKFFLVPGLLTGGHCYGGTVKLTDGTEQIYSVIGAWTWDGTGTPAFDKTVVPTIVHEFAHSYVNPIVYAHADELQKAGEQIFSHTEKRMTAQAYGNWTTVMHESLVRASVVRYLLSVDGVQASEKQVRYERGKGFTWVGDLASLLEEYESDRRRYPTFESFMPRIVAFFDDCADSLAKRQQAAPKVLAIIPPNGATDVDPNLKQIKITFDRPMSKGGYSVCGSGPNFPEIVGKVAYDREGKVFTIPVRLKPKWTYTFSINCPSFQSFRSKGGIPLAPFPVTFTTRTQ